jgi:hypothetical protein
MKLLSKRHSGQSPIFSHVVCPPGAVISRPFADGPRRIFMLLLYRLTSRTPVDRSSSTNALA